MCDAYLYYDGIIATDFFGQLLKLTSIKPKQFRYGVLLYLSEKNAYRLNFGFQSLHTS